jgi:WD40 repeat protein
MKINKQALVLVFFSLILSACTIDAVVPTSTLQNMVELTSAISASDTDTSKTLPPLSLETPTASITSTEVFSTPSPTRESPLDFSKYGPISYIDGHTFGVRLINADGSLPEWFYLPDLGPLNDHAWSADGEYIVFTRLSDKALGELYTLSVKDEKLEKINAGIESSIIQSPAVSPDGKTIIFFGYNEGAIFRVNWDGSGLLNLTPNSRYRNSSEFPSWSPGGNRILYSQIPEGLLYSMLADGSGIKKLTESGYNEMPVYSPDGRWIAFLRYSSKWQSYLYVMPAEGGNMRALSDDTTDVSSFSWSPDGKYLVFISFDNDSHRYWVVELSSARRWQLITPYRVYGKLMWSPVMHVADAREDCSAGWSKLAVGDLVNLIGNIPNRLRSEPLKGNNVIGEFLAGETYYVLDGPVCADGLIWWEVADPRLPGGSGWTAEGDGIEYWLEPIDL